MKKGKPVLITLSLLLITGIFSGCFLGEKEYKPGEQMEDGKWYAEHDYGLGDRTVKGTIDDSAIEWEDKYMNEVEYSLVRVYSDGTEVDLLANVRDEHGLLRMACNIEDDSFVITGLPSWERTDDSYVKGRIFNYGGNSAGQHEGFEVEKKFYSEEEAAAETVLDIGTYKLKPINSTYSLTINLVYKYKGSGSEYVVKTYDEAAALGFSLSASSDRWFVANGYETGNYARVIHQITNEEIKNGKIVVSDCIGGGKYSASAGILLNGNMLEECWTVELNADNPTPELTATILLD